MDERESKFPDWLIGTGKFTDVEHDPRCVHIKNGKRKFIKESELRIWDRTSERIDADE